MIALASPSEQSEHAQTLSSPAPRDGEVTNEIRNSDELRRINTVGSDLFLVCDSFSVRPPVLILYCHWGHFSHCQVMIPYGPCPPLILHILFNLGADPRAHNLLDSGLE